MNFFVQGQSPEFCILCYVLNLVPESCPKVCLVLFLSLLIHLSSCQRGHHISFDWHQRDVSIVHPKLGQLIIRRNSVWRALVGRRSTDAVRRHPILCKDKGAI